MARDKVTVLLPVQDDSQSIEVGEVTPKAVTVANGIEISDALDNKNNSLQIYIQNTANAAKNVTIKAGDNYPNAMLGDKVVSAASEKITVVLLEDISRFENRDKSVYLDFAAGFTGNVWAVAKRAGIKPVV